VALKFDNIYGTILRFTISS